jgi:hypothetical protein
MQTDLNLLLDWKTDFQRFSDPVLHELICLTRVRERETIAWQVAYIAEAFRRDLA